MARTVPESKFTEWEGLDRIQQTVHAMKCIWRELQKDDFGIDGEIEVVVPKPGGQGYQTNGSIVKVQAKSGKRYVVADTPDSFSTPVEKEHLESWNSLPYPTLLIVYHPKDQKLYAREVKDYVHSDPEAFKPPYRICFNKGTDEFNVGYFDKVAAYAATSPPRISFTEKERLFSNLLPVKRLPRLYEALATVEKADDVFKEIVGHIPPFYIRGATFLTLDNLFSKKSGLRRFTKGRIDKFTGNDALMDDERHNDYVFLLNQLLRRHLYLRYVSYNKHFRRYYFRRQDDEGIDFKKDWVSVRTGRKAPPRILAHFYEYGRDKSIKFWRHLAASISFVLLGSELFLQITPKYLFTENGETPCERDFVGPYTTRLKANEHNPQVLNHVLFWSWYMADGKDQIVIRDCGRDLLKIERMPVVAVSPFALPLDPAIYDEPTTVTRQPLLFGEPDEEYEEENDEG